MGCLLADSDFSRVYPVGTATATYADGDEPLMANSGNHDFDRALAQMLATCAKLFGVLPGFAFYDDDGAPNAYATPRVRMNRADGTVLMGQSFLADLMARKEAPDACVAAVCAHEFGHIVQYKHNLFDVVDAGQSTVKRSELQADYFAGYFAGKRKRVRPSFPAAVFAATQFSLGDNLFNDPGHHGTPKERGDAIVRGFEAAYKDNLSLGGAIERSTRYVLSI